MAESIVQVTEGTGKKLHTFNRTIGANSIEDEVVLLGENYLASYIVNSSGTGTSLATANAHLFQVMAGASLKVRIRRIEVYQTALATTAAIDSLYLYRLTTAGTGGTAYTPAPLDTTDAASGATAMTAPTVKGTESTLIAAGDIYLMQTAGASSIMQQPALVWDFDRPRSKPLIIQAGAANGIAIKNALAIAGCSVHINIWIDESNF